MKENKTIKDSVEIPESFAMFTRAGNKRLRDIASKLLESLDELRTPSVGGMKISAGVGSISGVVAERKAFTNFFRSWMKMHKTKSYPESSDTAVREEVWYFAMRAAEYSQYTGEDDLERIWQDHWHY